METHLKLMELFGTDFYFVLVDILCPLVYCRCNTRCVWKLPIVYPLTNIDDLHLYSSMVYRVPSDKKILQYKAR